ncbi:MAG: hypothetical protein U5J62_04305 [Desulfurivibrio sp.]|nr:hypothetical protein [Desulfurivibrio sp.]
MLGAVIAQAADKERRKVPPLTERVYKQISEAQLLIDPESVPVPEGEEPPDVEANPQEGIDQLKDLLDRRGINSYERAQIWNTLGLSGYYTMRTTSRKRSMPTRTCSRERSPKRSDSPGASRPVPASLRGRELRALTAVHPALGGAQRDPGPGCHVHQGDRVLPAAEQYQKSLDVALEIERVAKAQERTIKESWWYLQVVLYNEMNAYREVIPVLEKAYQALPQEAVLDAVLAGMYGRDRTTGRGAVCLLRSLPARHV